MNKIQRKFLISTDIERWIKEKTTSIEKTEQFYITSNDDTTCYFLRHFPNTYTQVIIDTKEKESILTVSNEVYLAERKKHIGRKIVKKYYTITVEEEIYVFAKYFKKFEGLYILSVYFKDEKALRASQTLQSLQPFIIKAIDKGHKYTDKSLALCVKPMEYNLNKLFENIDAYESSNLFFWQVQQRIYLHDGVALILYRNLRLLHHYKVIYQQKNFSASLHRLRVIMRRTATLLEIFPLLFNPNVQRFCVDLLLRFHEQTKLLRYLYYIEELYATQEDTKIKLHSELKHLIAQEQHNIKQMLLSQPFVQMIRILTIEIQEEHQQECDALTTSVKKALKNHLHTFENLLAQTRNGYDDALLEQLYHNMDTSQTLIEDFFHIIGKKSTNRMVEEINILLKPLREYRNCKERADIMQAIKEQSAKHASLDTEPVLCKHIDDLEEKIKDALKLLRSSKFYV